MICIHGFLATDLGTFDDFIDGWRKSEKRWRKKFFRLFQGQSKDQALFIGWPHNSMASIDFNGEQLAGLIATHLGKQSSDIVLLCHSRGGLVVRSAYSYLRTQHATVSSWSKRICGLMTFGTPHNGLRYRLPFRTVSTIALHGLASKTIASIDRSLIYLYYRGRFAGIEDLHNPSNDDETFLSRLRAREFRARRPRLIAYGGDVDRKPREEGISAYFRALLSTIRKAVDRGQSHDLILPTGTTLPAWANVKRVVPRHHSEYFRPGPPLDMAVADMATLFFRSRTIPHAPTTASEEEIVESAG